MVGRKKSAARKAPAKKKAQAPEPVQKLKWTAERQEIFFRELAELCNVAAAARAAGFEDGEPAYKEKDKNPAFRARYEAAVAEGYSRLELEMLERSRFGEDRPADAGKSGERLRQVPTALALSLLRLHNGKVKGTAPTLGSTRSCKPQSKALHWARLRPHLRRASAGSLRLERPGPGTDGTTTWQSGLKEDGGSSRPRPECASGTRPAATGTTGRAGLGAEARYPPRIFG
ncbi:MAG TPA: hypothetical protein VGR19_10405 [Allosphingosinicella sp.]|nr:hypothetical protein [Allosphingosinicella sp.]